MITPRARSPQTLCAAFHFEPPLGRPIPQPRPRAASRGSHAKVYNPSPSRLVEYKRAIAEAVPSEIRGVGWTGPVGLVVEMWYARPASHLNAAGEVKGDGYANPAPVAPIAQLDGDVDNLHKTIMDVLQRQGVYANDSQVTDPAGPIKRYATPGEPGMVYVGVYLWTTPPEPWWRSLFAGYGNSMSIESEDDDEEQGDD